MQVTRMKVSGELCRISEASQVVTADLSEHNEATNEHVDDDPIEG